MPVECNGVGQLTDEAREKPSTTWRACRSQPIGKRSWEDRRQSARVITENQRKLENSERNADMNDERCANWNTERNIDRIADWRSNWRTERNAN
ncbi:unnamed protein product [Caenorhabditis sp. 36 PRJEB53466]|nr:unnamed protein product [Caenorhabditis sp. 36 PRJEB53466]